MSKKSLFRIHVRVVSKTTIESFPSELFSLGVEWTIWRKHCNFDKITRFRLPDVIKSSFLVIRNHKVKSINQVWIAFSSREVFDEESHLQLPRRAITTLCEEQELSQLRLHFFTPTTRPIARYDDPPSVPEYIMRDPFSQ